MCQGFSSSVPHAGGEWIFFLIYLILPAALVPAVYSASNRKEYQNQRNNDSGE
jgi:hypothetical protein